MKRKEESGEWKENSGKVISEKILVG